MYSKLQELIFAATGIDLGGGNEPVDINAQIAVASLLVVAAKSDGRIDGEETARMAQALCGRFSLTPMVADDLINRAIHAQATGGDAATLYAELNKRLTSKHKEELILMLLEVIAADGEKKADELALLDGAVSALNISSKQLGKIYQRYFDARRKNGP
jgi:uncharacterized tellurite resistance protein B-like protein